jgi:Putative peptidoglycan binding domain
MTFKRSPEGFRNVEGPLIKSVQARLNAQGFRAGPADGVWGNQTETALCKWQESHHLQPTGTLDKETWGALMRAPLPALSERALQLTGAWEGTGYGGTNGNFDGQGITWGIVGFTWGNGELQKILGDVRALHPAIFHDAFGLLEKEMTDILARPLTEQMEWAQRISAKGGEQIAPEWAAAFKALGDAPEVQTIENNHAQHYWDAAITFASNFALKSEAGLALCFDVAVQNRITASMIAEIESRTRGTTGCSEVDKMRVIASVVAGRANPKYHEDVLSRKMTFVLGRGEVHGDRYDIGCWGIG